jgi:pyruvate formate lyase activating enzyme
MKESYLYKKLENKKTQCQTCSHRCLISPENFGICGVRKNIDGKLFALNYGKAISESIDPIEKKPLFHFLPGTSSLSIATVGCNLRCGNCQNWQISQLVKTDKSFLEMGENLSPEKIVADAIKNNCPSIAYTYTEPTYTEPTIFLEYALDTMKLAKEKNIKNIWVTNGFMSNETLALITPYLDAANVDLKSFDDEFYKTHCGAKVGPVLENLEKIKKAGIWLEVTTLIIPTLTDDKKMLENIAKFIFDKLGNETPWHVSAFSGAISYKMQNIPDTPVEKIYQAREIGKKAGLKYVYTGNI